MKMFQTFGRFPVRAVAMALAVGLVAGSCTEDKPAPKSDLNLKALLPDELPGAQPGGAVVMTSSPNVTVGAPANLGSPTATGARPTGPAAVAQAPKPTPAPKAEVVVPPKDAKWTISCTVIGGPAHADRARQLKERLASVTGSSKWYLVHDDDKSTIYYGFYRTIDRGTKDGDVAQADRQTIANLKNSSGEAPLALCSFMMIDRLAPEAPNEWDLSAHPRDSQHYWSLQIAAYTADAHSDDGDASHDRKWAAVETVKTLRAQGLPAYYYHGDSISSVCLGIWPEAAVKKQDGADAYGDASTLSAEQDLFVSDRPLPRSVIPKSPNGRPMKKLAPRIEILDPTLFDMTKRFPSHSTNGFDRQIKIRGVNDQPATMAEPSYLVLMPEAKPGMPNQGGGPGAVDGGQLPLLPPALIGADNRLPPQPGVGRLRQVGQ